MSEQEREKWVALVDDDGCAWVDQEEWSICQVYAPNLREDVKDREAIAKQIADDHNRIPALEARIKELERELEEKAERLLYLEERND